jgi:hypothetical protein
LKGDSDMRSETKVKLCTQKSAGMPLSLIPKHRFLKHLFVWKFHFQMEFCFVLSSFYAYIFSVLLAARSSGSWSHGQ